MLNVQDKIEKFRKQLEYICKSKTMVAAVGTTLLKDYNKLFPKGSSYEKIDNLERFNEK